MRRPHDETIGGLRLTPPALATPLSGNRAEAAIEGDPHVQPCKNLPLVFAQTFGDNAVSEGLKVLTAVNEFRASSPSLSRSWKPFRLGSYRTPSLRWRRPISPCLYALRVSSCETDFPFFALNSLTNEASRRSTGKSECPTVEGNDQRRRVRKQFGARTSRKPPKVVMMRNRKGARLPMRFPETSHHFF